MEVEVLGVDGAPKDAIVSIRAGSSRRQAQVSALTSSGTPFRFGGFACVNPFKLDLLQPLGTARLALKPGGSGTYTLPLETPDGDRASSVTLAVREVSRKQGDHEDLGQDLFDRIDVDKDGVVSRQESAQALRREGETRVLQPLDNGRPLGLCERGGSARLPPLEKDGDRLPAAAAVAKKYLESHNLLPFVRALLQTVVRERPDDPFAFIADQFRNAATASAVLHSDAAPATPGVRQLPKSAAAGGDSRPEDAAAAAAQGGRGISAAASRSGAPPAAGPVPAPSPLPNLGPTPFRHLPSTGTWLQRLPAQRSPPFTVRGICKESKGEEEGAQLVLQQAPLAKAMSVWPHPGQATLEEMEAARGHARHALANALLAEPNLRNTGEMEGARARARDALTSALMSPDVSAGGTGADAAASVPEDECQIDAWKKHARVALESALLSRERDDPEEGDEMEEAEEEEEEKSEQEEEEDDDDQELEHLKALAQRSLGTAFITKPLDEAKQLAKDALAAALLLDRASEDDRFKGCPSEDIQAAKTRCREALVAALDTEVLDRQVQLEEAMELARDALTCALATEQHVTPEEYENSKAEAREAMVKALNVTPQHRQVSLIGEDVESSKSACRDAIKRALLGGAGDEEAEGKEVDPHAKEAEEMESFDEMRTKLVATREDMTTFNASLKAEVNELKHSLNGLMKERDLLKSRLLSSGVLQ